MRADPRLDGWLEQLLATPGLTAIRDAGEARRQHVADSLAAVPVLGTLDGSIVDVGSGGGAPGVPLAAAFPDREVTLLEASSRKCAFLREATRDFPNVRVLHGRAEDQAVDRWRVAVAKALAPPAVAAEWCLPLVQPGGAVVLYVGADPELERVASVAEKLAGSQPVVVGADARRHLVVIRKERVTPPGFPRRPGVARKRPLA